MGLIVCKFGGTSLADAEQFRKVKAIVEADPQRRYVVPSAPGKRTPDDRKITDLLYLCHAHAEQQISFDDVFELIAERYWQIIADLDLDLDLKEELRRVKRQIATGQSADYAASRGEYLNGQVLAKLLGCAFVDAAEVIHFTAEGRLDRRATRDMLRSRLQGIDRAVIPGFYGSLPDGSIKTFSRGGSDISGALVAAGMGAEVYENWTDVSGLLMADPRIVEKPRKIDVLTYRELRELAYMGANVLHDEAIFPVRDAGIPVNLRNTNAPDEAGTMIVKEAGPITQRGTISGVAGRKDFTVIAIEKALMNAEVGFGRKVLGVLEQNGVSYEHMPSGIDTLSVVVADAAVKGKLDTLVEQLQRAVDADTIEVHPDMALVATVGRGMAHTPGMAAKLFAALAGAEVNVRMIDQGSSELNIIVGVEAGEFERAIRAVYQAFVPAS
jgi:aspartate kinase